MAITRQKKKKSTHNFPLQQPSIERLILPHEEQHCVGDLEANSNSHSLLYTISTFFKNIHTLHMKKNSGYQSP